MPEVTQLTLAVDSRQVRTAAGDLDKLSKEGKAAAREADTLGKVYQGLGRVLGTLGLAVLSRQVIAAADAYKNMTARLQLATSSMAELANAQQGVFDISQRTRVSLGQTADLFTSLSRSTQALGVSQSDLLAVTESINQALIVSGTSAAGAQAALVQLGQGFASGVLRGEELNSVLEQAPRLAKALADGLGVPQGELRRLGQEGELTAEKVFRALQKSGAALNEEFAKMPLTVDQATTQAGNSISRLIGLIDKATGATAGLATVISGMARGLDVEINRLSDNAIVRAQAEVDILRQRLIIMMQSRTAEHPGVRLLQKQLDDAAAKLKGLKDDLANNQSSAETARLGRSRPTTVIGPDLNTISGIQQQIKNLKDLRDSADIGSAKFKQLSSEIKTYEERLKKLLPSGREKKAESKEVFTDYREQIAQRVGSLLEGSDVTQAQIYADTLKQLDALFFSGSLSAEQYDSAIKKLAGTTSSAEQETSKFIAEQQRLAELLGATESAGLEKQRQDMELLTKALIDGRIKESEYIEAVSARLNLVAEKTKEAKSFAEDLGLSFSSAFEDAVVGGKKASDVINGLIQDVARLFIRKTTTEPAANAFGKAVSGVDWGGLIKGIFGGASANALGGVYSAPGLSAYSGQTVSKPTLFPFANGMGLMGEAGAEGIFPLKRGKDGKLGVSAEGAGSQITVKLVNESGTMLQASAQRQSTMPDGTQLIEVILAAAGDAVANRSGPLSRGLEAGYGLRPAMG